MKQESGAMQGTAGRQGEMHDFLKSRRAGRTVAHGFVHTWVEMSCIYVEGAKQ